MYLNTDIYLDRQIYTRDRQIDRKTSGHKKSALFIPRIFRDNR